MSTDARAMAAPAAMEGDRSGKARLAIVALALLLAAVSLLSIASGPTGFMPMRALTVIGSAIAGTADATDRDTLVVLEIRLPRLAFSLLIGASLATAGCVMQGLFRNPFADPGLVGISSGAAFATVATIVLGGPFIAALPAFARIYALPLDRGCMRSVDDRLVLDDAQF